MRRYVAGGLIMGVLIYWWLKDASPFAALRAAREDQAEQIAALASMSPLRAPNLISSKLARVEKPTQGEFDSTNEAECAKKIKNDVEPIEVFERRNSRELNSVVGDWYFRIAAASGAHRPDESRASGLFLLGLAKAHLLDGENSIAQNDSEALTLLEEAHLQDPSNSAPLIFMAIVLRRLHLERELDNTFAKISRTQRYDSYLKSVAAQIYGVVQNPSDYVNAVSLWASALIPNMNGEFREMILKNHLSNVADQMIEDMRHHSLLKPDHEPAPDIDWIPVEVAFGLSLLRQLEPKRTDIPTQDEFREHLKVDAAAVPFIGEGGGTCDIDTLWSQVRQVQQAVHRN